MIADFKNTSTNAIGAYIFHAYIEKASVLSKKMIIFEELKTYDEIVDLWHKSGSNKEDYDVYAATALVNKALTLTKSGNPSDALNEANKVIKLFNLSLDHDVVEQTTKAAKLKTLLER